MEFFCQITSKLIARYIFIFWLKNPAGFHDRFWFLFITIWIKSTSRISQTIWYFLEERTPFGIFLCTGKDPTETMKHPLQSYNLQEWFSLILHIGIHLKIHMYKKKFPASPVPKPNFRRALKDIQLTNFDINLVAVLIVSLSTLIINKLSNAHPEDLSKYSFKYLVYFRSLAFAGLGIGVVCSMCFLRHEGLQTLLMNKIKCVEQ